MKEQEAQINRKQFLKFSAVACGALLAPNKALEINYDANILLKEVKEGQIEEYPRIIDNLEIRRGKQILDVFVDTNLVRTNIMNKAQQYMEPDKIPTIESRVNRLTISLGARDCYEVLADRLENDNRSLKEMGEYYNNQFKSKVAKLMDSGNTPYGTTDIENDSCLIYLNIPKIPNATTLRYVWDHETGHLITKDISEKAENAKLKYFKKTLMSIGADVVQSTTATLIGVNIFVEFSHEDIITFLKKNVGKIEVAFFTNNFLFIVPALRYVNDYYYMNFDDDEKEADNVALNFPTPDEEFAKMIRIVPRD
jgi:hypothetical protein